MLLAHLQRAGHRPIVVVGGGTGMIGDPTDKTEMRKLLTLEEIQANMAGLRPQFERYLDFEEGDASAAVMVNNADWLLALSYINFLRTSAAISRSIKSFSTAPIASGSRAP